jgi:hypothetical protein
MYGSDEFEDEDTCTFDGPANQVRTLKRNIPHSGVDDRPRIKHSQGAVNQPAATKPRSLRKQHAHSALRYKRTRHLPSEREEDDRLVIFRHQRVELR